MGKTRPRLVLIGLDGATWDVVAPLLESGKLPTLRCLSERGQFGTLRSVIPPLTGPAWATILTGANPGEHGIFEMTVYDERLGRRRPISMADWRAKPLWETLNEHGLSTGLLCVPFTYPPPRVNGWVVSGIMGTPRYDQRMFNPPALYEELTSVAGEFPLATPFRRAGRFPMDVLNRQINWLHKAAVHLLKNHPVDVFVLVENYTDHVSHFFLRSRIYEYQGEKIDLLEYAYTAADALVAAIWEVAGEETAIVVLSDHGFTPMKGYLNFGIALADQHPGEIRRVSAVRALWRAARGILPFFISERIRRPMKRARPTIHVGGVGAFGSIFMKVQDLPEVERRLGELRDPRTNELLVEFHRAEELYHGRSMAHAPVAVAVPAKGWQTKLATPRDGPLLTGPRWMGEHEATHALEGIILSAGFSADLPLPTDLESVARYCLSCCLVNGGPS